GNQKTLFSLFPPVQLRSDFQRSANKQEQQSKRRRKLVQSFISRLLLSLMHPLFQKASGLTETIIAAALEVHRNKGPGLIESIYEWCLVKELGLRNLACISQKSVLIEY